MLEKAKEFAELLDRNNFYEAKKMIHEDCIYRFRDQVIEGPDNIIGCYQGSYDSVFDQLDEIILESDVVEIPENRFQMNYLDVIKKNGDTHEHRCQQRIKFSDNQVVEIEHIDLEGETESLNKFFEKHGVVRKKARPSFIGNYKNFMTPDDNHYPGSDELLSIGSPVGKALGLERIGVHVETIPPGRRTSWPHAESDEEEFAYVIEGRPQVWVDGELYDLIPGDFVAFPAGTGISHTFINNSDKNAVLLVGGEATKKSNRCFYPLHPKRNETMSILWENPPRKNMGPHNGFPDTYGVDFDSLKTRPAKKSEAQFLSDLAYQSKGYWDILKNIWKNVVPPFRFQKKILKSGQ